VIWDLDETLWTGTLSEEAVTLDPAHAEIVRELNRRGIMNSICSKNDRTTAQEHLAAENLWEEFVFPSISWSPKGQQISQIIEHMQLRAENVLFIDDNVGNLQEARYYVPGIQTAGPELIDELLSLEQLKGKDDSKLSRLNQYRLLEQKVVDRAVTTGSNEDFLRSCNIQIYLGDDCSGESARLIELMNRTNQLNYTKHRVTDTEFYAMLAEDGRETRYVHVTDRYGDYGICGLYSLHDGHLTDFVFSCRILHMGVEQWLYNHLGRPRLNIAGDVSTPLEADTDSVIDWITLINEQEQPPTPASEAGPATSLRILLKGGCDLWLVHDFLHGSLVTEFNYPSNTGADVRSDHTEVLRRSSPQVLAEFGHVIDRLPFLDREALASQIMQAPDSFGTVIYSVLMDYTQGLYRFDNTSFVVTYGQHDEDITDETNWPYLERRFRSTGIDRAFLIWFSEHFNYEGALTPEAFQDNIRWLANQLSGINLVLINGAEVPFANEREPDRHLHHHRMNTALDEIAKELPNVVVCDVRDFVSDRSDLMVSSEPAMNNIRHYSRRVFLQIAEQLTELVQDDIKTETRAPLVAFRKLHRRTRRKIARTIRDLKRQR